MGRSLGVTGVSVAFQRMLVAQRLGERCQGGIMGDVVVREKAAGATMDYELSLPTCF